MITSDQMIELHYTANPQKTWEMDEATLSEVKNMRDSNGTYLWTSEPNYPDMPGRLFGIQISVAGGFDRCCQLSFLFNDGVSHTIPANFIKKGELI